MKKVWFKNKQFGWGWTPVSWEGWATLCVFVGLLVLIVSRTDFEARGAMPIYFIKVLLLVSLLLVISYWKGEPPRWQWGTKKDKSSYDDKTR